DGGKLKRSATNEPSILSFFSLVFAWMTKNLLWTDFQSRFFYKLKPPFTFRCERRLFVFPLL
ncbi:MAG TPA: hypothetical protein H9698_02885, partial [Candidatus Ruthenibacterium merdavium]|nr:hypothetical protein [Candidatus Ruthenibacterium merdavium]